MKDPYKTLKVKKTATADMIRKAYRKLAANAHPDRNPGDPKAAGRFKEIQDAYDLLKDADRKDRFDKTGDTTPPNPAADANIQELLVECMAQTIQEIVNRNGSMKQTHLIKRMIERTKAEKGKTTETHKKIQSLLTNLTEAKKRLSVKEGENILSKVLGNHIADVQRDHDKTKKILDMLDACLVVLDRYEYEVEKSPTTSVADLMTGAGLFINGVKVSNITF